MELFQITPGSKPDDFGLDGNSPVGVNFKMQVDYYSRIGFHPPWVGYLALIDGTPVGMGAFKGAPTKNRVEIAYFTFPEYEGKGYGTKICKELISTAFGNDEQVEITARTLPEKNASTRILSKNGFALSSKVHDPEDGEVWEWVYKPAT
jgi:ribosomal-protein-alanine N-acetyltransferase